MATTDETSTTSSFQLPPHGSAEGLEGFTLEDVDGRELGRVAALSRSPDGLVLLVDDGTGYRPLAARHVAAVRAGSERLRLAESGRSALASAPAVEPRQSSIDGPELVRYIPAELMPLVEVRPSSEEASWWWLAAFSLIAIAAFTLLPVHFVLENEVGGAFRWFWFALPILLLALAGRTMSKAVDAENRRKLPLGEKLAYLPSFLLGTSPWSTLRRR